MNNPFSRLKHYMRSEIDPQENHATECLAACLVFSSKLRDAFIQFLLNAERGKDFGSTDSEVLTQERIEGGPIESVEQGYIDLVLRQPGTFVIAVEVKVRSPENCKHHQNQLLRYKAWLDEQTKEPRRFLFTLVRNEDKTFHPQQYGATGRRTWWALYKDFNEMLKVNNLSDVESSLIENFCGYLESEGIVSTYEVKDLLSYEAGMKARKAVTGIFNQIGSRLEADKFQSVYVDRKDWPQLKIQHPRWDEIFGSGNNQKIALWFYVPGIWGAEKYGFSPDIELWHREHRNDWRLGKPKLSKWFATLQSRGFRWDVYERGFNKARENLAAREIQSEPARIVAYKEGDDVVLDPSQLPSEDELINTLVNLIKDYAKAVDSLAS